MARFTVEGSAPVPLEMRPLVARSTIAGDYFSTMKIPIVAGRRFSDADTRSGASALVAVVNVEAVRRFWPGRDPLGARFALDAAPGAERWATIVGVVGNVRSSDIDNGGLPQVYLPMSSRPTREMAVMVRSVSSNPLLLVGGIRTQVAQVDREQPIHGIVTMSKVLFDDLASTYVLAALLSVIGFVALCMSAAGIYGLVSYSVTQRWREIGIRMALGARPGGIARMMVAAAARPVLAGALLGVLVAGGVALALSASLPEIDARDPVNYLVTMATLASVAAVASYLPARRAASLNPLDSLRRQ